MFVTIIALLVLVLLHQEAKVIRTSLPKNFLLKIITKGIEGGGLYIGLDFRLECKTHKKARKFVAVQKFGSYFIIYLQCFCYFFGLSRPLK
jgi:hypothetical protein